MKELLSTDELINHMKKKGIKFNITTENEAARFLKYNNYYFKLAAYRQLYLKIPENNVKSGQYQNLEFAYLQELSILDKDIRYLIVDMCLDIEHAIKVKLVNAVTSNPQEDGYEIVKSYLKKDKNLQMLKIIRSHKSGEYCKNLINKYYPFFPIWVLVELIPFGYLLHITQFYEEKYQTKLIPENKFMNTVRDFRNASAHSNCLINNMLSPLDKSKQPDKKIIDFIQQLENISKNSRHVYLNKNFTYNLVSLLCVYKNLMSAENWHQKVLQLQDFLNNRALLHKDYFATNIQIKGTYNFLSNVIDSLIKQS